MERSEIQNLIMGEIKKVNKNMPEYIPPEDHLMAEWGFESIDMAELVARAEQQLKVEIPDSVWKKLVTVKSITDFIYEHLEPQDKL